MAANQTRTLSRPARSFVKHFSAPHLDGKGSLDLPGSLRLIQPVPFFR